MHYFLSSIARALREFETGVQRQPALNLKSSVDQELEITAKIIAAKEKKITLDYSSSAAGTICATANMIAVRVPPGWF